MHNLRDGLLRKVDGEVSVGGNLVRVICTALVSSFLQPGRNEDAPIPVKPLKLPLRALA